MILALVLLFFAGALICNAIPHLANGVSGAPFSTPFAKPPGKGKSLPLVNFLWGSANLFAGVALAAWQGDQVDLLTMLVAMALGWLVLGFYLSRHFGQVHAADQRRT